MKIAVIGAGLWGRNIIRNLYDMGLLAAVCEYAPDNMAFIQENYPNLPIYHNVHDLLADQNTLALKGVCIATPVPTHFELAKLCLEHHLDTFVEKPITYKLQEAQDLCDLAKKNQCILMTGHLLLYQPAIQFIKEYLTQNKLGKLHSLHQVRCDLGRAQAVENTSWAMGVHDLAVLLYLIEEKPISHTINSQVILNKNPENNIEDDVYIHMKFANNIQAHLHNSWLWPLKERRLIIIGELGMIVYDELKQTVILHNKTIALPSLKNQDHGEVLLFEGNSQPLRLELTHFVDCINSRETPISSGQSALPVIELLETLFPK